MQGEREGNSGSARRGGEGRRQCKQRIRCTGFVADTGRSMGGNSRKNKAILVRLHGGRV